MRSDRSDRSPASHRLKDPISRYAVRRHTYHRSRGERARSREALLVLEARSVERGAAEHRCCCCCGRGDVGAGRARRWQARTRAGGFGSDAASRPQTRSALLQPNVFGRKAHRATSSTNRVYCDRTLRCERCKLPRAKPLANRRHLHVHLACQSDLILVVV